MAAQRTDAGFMVVDKTLLLYLDPGNPRQREEAIQLLRGLEQRGFVVHFIADTERDEDAVTPRLVDPTGSSYNGLSRIKGFVNYKLASLSRDRST